MNNINSIKFSIVIPIYKVEDYLSKCVNSVLNQDFKNFEIILVDDGSPDNCPEICDEFALNDARIKVIHKENGGLSDARNFGIKAASGEYLLFLDSDDYWEGTNCISELHKKTSNKNDVILYGTKDVDLKTGATSVTRWNYDILALERDKQSAMESLFENNHFPGSAWVVSIRREFITQHKLFFEKGIKSEDIDWLVNVFFHAKTISAVNIPFYMYIKARPGSITTTTNITNAKDILFSVKKWQPILKSNINISNRLLLSYLAYQYITAYIIYSNLKDKEKKELYTLLIDNKNILKFATSKRGEISKKIIYIFGINFSAKIFNFAYSVLNKTPILKKVI